MIAISQPPANPRATTFVGHGTGSMRVVSHATLAGAPIAQVESIDMVAGVAANLPLDAMWVLHGVATNDRYSTRAKKDELTRKQARIGRPGATCAALFLLRKRPDWWVLTQEERRTILEADWHHIAIGMRYLPAIARRLLHCRDLDAEAPFDFLGFLDFAPGDAAAFDDMLAQSRATAEWAFMDREIDIRLGSRDKVGRRNEITETVHGEPLANQSIHSVAADYNLPLHAVL